MEDKSEKETENFVNAVLKGKNVAAAKSLEKIIQRKCADKIKKTLQD